VANTKTAGLTFAVLHFWDILSLFRHANYVLESYQHGMSMQCNPWNMRCFSSVPMHCRTSCCHITQAESIALFAGDF